MRFISCGIALAAIAEFHCWMLRPIIDAELPDPSAEDAAGVAARGVEPEVGATASAVVVVVLAGLVWGVVWGVVCGVVWGVVVVWGVFVVGVVMG